MKQPDTTLPATATAGSREPTRGTMTSQTQHPCLVFSADASRCAMLTRAMADAGWAPIVCQQIDQFSVQGARVRAPLAIIDLVGTEPAVRQQCQTLCQRLLASQRALLAVCGHEGDAGEEIWARQIGVWLYLPGLGDEEDVSQFATEARGVVEKLFPELRETDAASAHNS